MPNIDKNVTHVSEKYEYERCKYCSNSKTHKSNAETESTTHYSLTEDSGYDIDNRIRLFGWRLRLASGKINHSVRA